MENVGCLGRLIAEVKSNSSKNKSESTPLVKRNSLRRMGFKYMLNDSTVHFTSGNKMKVLLFYNYSIGNYYNAFFTEIARMLKENPDLLELFVITLDAYNFKN